MTLFAERTPFAQRSECGRYRYTLGYPTKHRSDRAVLMIGANPSTATTRKPDKTAAKWIRYAELWGYGWALMGNVRAWMSTDPKLVPDDPEAIGPDNARCLANLIAWADLVVCGWGKLGGEQGLLALQVLHSLNVTPHALKLNADGSPTHPLYLRGDLKPFPMEKK